MWCESHPSSPIRIVCPCTDAMWPNDVCHRYLKFKSVWPCSMCIHYNMLVSKPHCQISVIFMHAWVSNIRISYSNIWIQLYIDCDLTYSAILLHPHSSILFIIVPLTFSRACMHTHYQSALSIAHMQSFSSGRSPMKAHTHTHPPLHHIGHSLSLTRACATIDVPLCMCVYS